VYDHGGDSNAVFLDWIGSAYWYIGDYSKAQKYVKEALLRNAGCDIIADYYMLLFTHEKYKEANNFLDSIGNLTACGHVCDMMRFYYYTSQRDFKKAELYLNKALDAGYTQKYKLDHSYTVYYNYLLKETGRKNEAVSGLNNSIKRFKIQPLKRKYEDIPRAVNRLCIAASYAILGENEKALDYLSQLEKIGLYEYPITLSFPGFDNLRKDPEFKAIVKSLEDKRSAIREKVREMEQRGELHLCFFKFYYNNRITKCLDCSLYVILQST
jgi:tetratricopeptide (TPR) repeat protein